MGMLNLVSFHVFRIYNLGICFFFIIVIMHGMADYDKYYYAISDNMKYS